MNIIPYEYIMAWSIDPTTEDMVVMLPYRTFLLLKENNPDIKQVYKTQNYNKDYKNQSLLDVNDKTHYINYNPKFEEITDEIGLWLALVADNYT